MFFQNFEQLCKMKGKTTTGAGQEIGIPKTTVAYWRKNNVIPKPNQLSKIAKYFDVSISDLLGAEINSWCDASSFNEDESDKLVLRRRKIRRQDGRPVIRVTPAVYQIVADLSDDTGQTISDIASAMIEFASERTEIE